MKIITSTAILALITASVVTAPAQVAPKERSPAPRRMAGHSGPSPKLRAFGNELHELDRRAHDAEKRKDYASAEDIYLRMGDMMPHTPMGPIRLARLYDKTGRDRDAYAQYRLAVADYGTASSSFRDDMLVVVRYGDLCARFGSPEETMRAYAHAADLSDRDDVNEPRPTPTDHSFASLKAAAHTAAAIDLGGSGLKQDEVHELVLALKSDKGYWVAHYYYSRALKRLGRNEQAVQEAALAERLAPSASREMVRTMRRNQNIPDAKGNVLPWIPVPRSGSAKKE